METENINKIVKVFFTLQLVVKLYHWNTTSYARHKATDQFLDKLSTNVDKFVEIFIGKYKIKPYLSNIKLDNTYLTDVGIIDLLIQFRDFLNSISTNIKDTDLLTIRDELLGDLNQTLYLMDLK
jgi:hypothetical protein